MTRTEIENYCKEQGSILTVDRIQGQLSARVELPEGLEWSFGHTAIGFTQRRGQSDSEFWAKLFLGMDYDVVPEDLSGAS